MGVETYSVADDTLNGSVIPSILHWELSQDGTVGSIFNHLNAYQDNILVSYQGGSLTGPQQTAMDAVVAAHDGGVQTAGGGSSGDSEAESTTASTTYVNKLTMNIISSVQKDVMVHYSAEIGSTAGWCGVGVKVDHTNSASTVYTVAENQPMIYLLEWGAFCGFGKTTLTPGLNVLTIDYKAVVLFGATSAKIRRARMYVEDIP